MKEGLIKRLLKAAYYTSKLPKVDSDRVSGSVFIMRLKKNDSVVDVKI